MFFESSTHTGNKSLVDARTLTRCVDDSRCLFLLCLLSLWFHSCTVTWICYIKITNPPDQHLSGRIRDTGQCRTGSGGAAPRLFPRITTFLEDGLLLLHGRAIVQGGAWDTGKRRDVVETLGPDFRHRSILH